MPSDNRWIRIGTNIASNVVTYFESTYKLKFNTTDLANWIITPNVIQSMFSDPDSWLSSVMFYPFDVNEGRGTRPTQKLMIGPNQTDIEVEQVDNGLMFYYLGQYHVQPHFNNFADYDGYTRIRVWLPYYGFTEIPVNDCMGKWLQFRLRVDVRTGMGVYYIGVSDTSLSNPTTNHPICLVDDTNTRIISTVQVQMGVNIPLGKSDTAQVYRNIINNTVKAMGDVAGGYALAQLGSGYTEGKKDFSRRTTVRNAKTGRQRTFSTNQEQTTTSYKHRPYDTGSAVAEVFNSASATLAQMHSSGQADKPNAASVLADSPVSIMVVIYRPRLQPVTADYGALYGYPLGQTVELSTLTGYTEISNVHVEGTAFNVATSQEKAMLEEALKSGIIL